MSVAVNRRSVQILQIAVIDDAVVASAERRDAGLEMEMTEVLMDTVVIHQCQLTDSSLPMALQVKALRLEVSLLVKSMLQKEAAQDELDLLAGNDWDCYVQAVTL